MNFPFIPKRTAKVIPLITTAKPFLNFLKKSFPLFFAERFPKNGIAILQLFL